jgi:outer membrane receptor for ferrienterochelin and colicins
LDGSGNAAGRGLTHLTQFAALQGELIVIQAGLMQALLLGAATAGACTSVFAQQAGTAAGTGRVSYPSAFFQPYNPLTARDMVLQVPGFSLDEGGDARGFGGTAGNVLIGGTRPSTKNDDAGAMLGRIPSSQVLRIDLIRGDTGGLNLRGQTVVVDVILRTDALPATRWETRLRTTENTSTINPWGSISKTGYSGVTRFTVGVEGGEDRAHQARGTEWLLTTAGAAEQRQEEANTRGEGYSVNLNTETLFGTAVVHVNGRLGTQRLGDFESSGRLALLPDSTSRTVDEGRFSDIDTLELGSDLELTLSPVFTAKTIAVLNRGSNATTSSLRVLDPAGGFRSRSLADRSADNEEWIARLELDWTGWQGHRLELNLEGAWNSLDSAVDLRQDSGQGPRPVPLPGANSRIEENRGELEIVDSWQQGDVAVEAGLAAEFSTIEQSGDAHRSRSFKFLKPRLLLTFSRDPARQFRLRLQRDVAQLDFNDFASTTNFADNQFALGNPELKPDTT